MLRSRFFHRKLIKQLLRNGLNDSKAEFSTVTDNAQYINVNSETRFDPTFSKKEEPFSGNRCVGIQCSTWRFLRTLF